MNTARPAALALALLAVPLLASPAAATHDVRPADGTIRLTAHAPVLRDGRIVAACTSETGLGRTINWLQCRVDRKGRNWLGQTTWTTVATTGFQVVFAPSGATTFRKALPTASCEHGKVYRTSGNTRAYGFNATADTGRSAERVVC